MSDKKLEITIWYSNFIKQLRDKYKHIQLSIPFGFPEGFNYDTKSIESILKDDDYYGKCRKITAVQRVLWESYSYPTTDPRDEGWSTRECNKIQEVTGKFPLYIFEDRHKDQMERMAEQSYVRELLKDQEGNHVSQMQQIARKQDELRKIEGNIKLLEDTLKDLQS